MAKLAVISDIHDNVPNLEKTLRQIENEKIDYVICTGDVQSIECWQMIDQLTIPVYAVLGNVDSDIFGFEYLSKSLKNINLFENIGEVELGSKKIIFSHYPEVIKKAIQNKKYDLALHGHTHKPWEETLNNTKILNPGNVGNFRFSPTFAIIDLDNLKAKLILLDEVQ